MCSIHSFLVQKFCFGTAVILYIWTLSQIKFYIFNVLNATDLKNTKGWLFFLVWFLLPFVRPWMSKTNTGKDAYSVSPWSSKCFYSGGLESDFVCLVTFSLYSGMLPQVTIFSASMACYSVATGLFERNGHN